MLGALGAVAPLRTPRCVTAAGWGLLPRDKEHGRTLPPWAQPPPARAGAPGVGRLAAGSSPGVLALPLGGERPVDPLAWLLGPGASRPPEWLARHSPEVRA